MRANDFDFSFLPTSSFSFHSSCYQTLPATPGSQHSSTEYLGFATYLSLLGYSARLRRHGFPFKNMPFLCSVGDMCVQRAYQECARHE